MEYTYSLPCADFWSDRDFQRAVGIGILTGVIGGAIGVAGAGAFGGGLLGTALVGAVAGGVTGGTEESLYQLSAYGGIRDSQAIGRAILLGAAIGGASAAVGYGVGDIVRGISNRVSPEPLPVSVSRSPQPPNPWGKLGGPRHQAVVSQIESDIKARGLTPRTEYPVGGDGGTPFGYTGEQWDADTGLLYLRARYYSPEVGRFLTEDSWPGDVYNPKSLHLYTYAWNNPVMLMDPGGHQVPPVSTSTWECRSLGLCFDLPTLPARPPGTCPVIPPDAPILRAWQPEDGDSCTWELIVYKRPGYVHAKTELVPYYVSSDELPLPGSVEMKYSRVHVYSLPDLKLIGVYEETVGQYSLVLGAPPVADIGVSVQAGSQSGPDSAATGEIPVADLEIGLRGAMAYLKTPMAGSKSGIGLEWDRADYRYIIACSSDVRDAGGYEKFGEQYVDKYEFVRVADIRDDKGGLLGWWGPRLPGLLLEEKP